MQMRIDEIIVRKRLRRDLGNLGELSESIKQHGLLNPIIVNNKNVLIAGHRRLEAAKKLGWETISVNIFDNLSKLQEVEIEIAENINRKSFNPDEASDAYKKLDKLYHPNFLRRLFAGIKGVFKKIFKLLRP